MPGELAEGSQVRVSGFEVANVCLILDDRYAIDGRKRPWSASSLTDSALRRRHTVAAADAIHRHTGIEIVEISGVKVVFANIGLLTPVKDAAHPVIRSTSF
jgi:hypothetical protein